MSNFLYEDKVVIMGIPLYLKASVIPVTLIIIYGWGSPLYVSYWYWRAFPFFPLFIVAMFFTKCIIHEKGIDLLLGIVDYKMKNHTC